MLNEYIKPIIYDGLDVQGLENLNAYLYGDEMVIIIMKCAGGNTSQFSNFMDRHGFFSHSKNPPQRLKFLLRVRVSLRLLEFPLKEIKAILDSPNFDASEAISQQIELLELKCKHIEELHHLHTFHPIH